jgi:hypothetical protein
VVPGSYNVNASKTGFTTTFTETVLVAGKTTTLNILIAPPLPTGKGRIIGRAYNSETNLNLAGVKVVATPWSGSGSFTATTDSTGHYHLVPIPEGDYDLVASKQGMISDTQFVHLGSQSTQDSINFRLVESVPSNGLTAFFRFDGDAKDALGKSNGGTLSGATATTDRFGTASGALAFNGTSSFVSVPSTNELNLGGTTSDFTVAFWAKMSGSQTEKAGVISKATYDATYLIDQGYEFYIYSGTIGALLSTQTSLKSYSGAASVWNDGDWHLVTLTYSRSGHSSQVYIDGSVLGFLTLDDAATKLDFGNTLPLIFGKDASGTRYFKGSIDEVRIYNRALTDTEVDRMFHDGGWQ